MEKPLSVSDRRRLYEEQLRKENELRTSASVPLKSLRTKEVRDSGTKVPDAPESKPISSIPQKLDGKEYSKDKLIAPEPVKTTTSKVIAQS